MSKQKILFCLANGTITGGNIMLLELAARLLNQDYETEVYFQHQPKSPTWFSGALTVCAEPTIESACMESYDFIIFSNAFLVPLALPFMQNAHPVLFCQSYESYCYGNNSDEIFAEIAALTQVLQLPISLLSVSRSVQNILLQRHSLPSFLVPAAIDHDLFKALPPRDLKSKPKRILFVGDFNWTLKGFDILCQSLRLIESELSLELVLVTQQKRGLDALNRLPFPVEVHVRPNRQEIPQIYASCDVYCCASVYEGFGLPSIESMAVGVPVVSTANLGVSDFGKDNHNMLIAESYTPECLADKLSRVLTDAPLAQLLRQNGLQTALQYTWKNTLDQFIAALESIRQSPPRSREISRTEADCLTRDLESAGLYVTTETLDALTIVSDRLEQLCDQLQTYGRSERLIDELNSITEELRLHTADPNSPCYKDFKARYDLCRLLLSLRFDQGFDQYLTMVCRKTQNRVASAESHHE